MWTPFIVPNEENEENEKKEPAHCITCQFINFISIFCVHDIVARYAHTTIESLDYSVVFFLYFLHFIVACFHTWIWNMLSKHMQTHTHNVKHDLFLVLYFYIEWSN